MTSLPINVGVLTLLISWTKSSTCSIWTREEASVRLVTESYSQYPVTILYTEDILNDNALSGLAEVIKSNPEPIQTVVGLPTGIGPYISEGVILLMLPLIGENFREHTDKLVQEIVVGKTFVERFRLVIGLHDLDTPSEEDLRWLQTRHRPSILLSVINSLGNYHQELMLAEYNSVNVRIRCTSLKLSECPGGPVYGSTIRVAYDIWYPITYTNENGQIRGFHHDVLQIIANKLNTIIKYGCAGQSKPYTMTNFIRSMDVLIRNHLHFCLFLSMLYNF